MILDALDNVTFGTDTLLEEFFSFKRGYAKTVVRLKNGRKVRFQQIRHVHTEGLVKLYKGLSPRSRRTRFCGELGGVADSFFLNLADATVKTCSERGLGWVVFECDSGELIGTCQLVHNGSATAEIALTIADQWQGVGLGKSMMKRMVREAKASGILTMEAIVEHGNSAMKLLLMRARGSLSRTRYSNCSLYRLHI